MGALLTANREENHRQEQMDKDNAAEQPQRAHEITPPQSRSQAKSTDACIPSKQRQAHGTTDRGPLNKVPETSFNSTETRLQAPRVDKRPTGTFLKPEERKFYDMVLSCRLEDLCDPVEDSTPSGTSSTKTSGWKLELDSGPGKNKDLGKWHGHVVGILGHYNRGKTWVMGRLSDYTFPTESMIIRTEGMSFKWIQTEPKRATGERQGGNIGTETTPTYKAASGEEESGDVRWHLAIDTAGFNTPITLHKPESPSNHGSIHLAFTDLEPWCILTQLANGNNVWQRPTYLPV